MLPPGPTPPCDGPTDRCYLPISEEMHSWECFVTTAGETVYLPGEPYPHRTHPTVYDFDWRSGRVLPEYQFVLLTAGQGEYEFRKDDNHCCAQGDLLQIVPGQWHRYRPDDRTGWSECWVGLGGEYLHRLSRKGLAFSRPCLAVGEHAAAIQAAFGTVIEMCRHPANANSPLLASEAFKIITLVALASREEAGTTPARQEREAHLGLALEFIWGNSHRPIRVADVADAVGLPPRGLERLFAAAHNSSVRREIEWSRFYRARRLISHTQLPLKEIAYTCGFGDPRRMIEVFRRRNGTTPGDLRAAGSRPEPAQVPDGLS